ncbi:MAG: hypothetical protein A3F09_00510 [Chlamydiae bacterium RIFCSPHIGHO2_12_FULL_49_11]|nr:MAG: hypothetical protein A3F09_00510 [Chlamydiae bacterium RIFCSPHIGHO2_12_FULL_49_11]
MKAALGFLFVFTLRVAGALLEVRFAVELLFFVAFFAPDAFLTVLTVRFAVFAAARLTGFLFVIFLAISTPK